MMAHDLSPRSRRLRETLGYRRWCYLAWRITSVTGVYDLLATLALSDRITLLTGSATAVPLRAASVEKVRALECAFHFETREAFFREGYRGLRPGEQLVLAIGVLSPLGSGRRAPSGRFRPCVPAPSAGHGMVPRPTPRLSRIDTHRRSRALVACVTTSRPAAIGGEPSLASDSS